MHPNQTPTEKAETIKAAYARAKAKASEKNRVTMVLEPGEYNFSRGPILAHPHVALVGTSKPSVSAGATKSALFMLAFLACFAAFVLFMCGCQTMATKSATEVAKTTPPIQQILDAMLPQGFRGDVAWDNNITGYSTFALKVGNLRHEAGGWVWDSLSFTDNNVLWHGTLTLTPAQSGVATTATK